MFKNTHIQKKKKQTTKFIFQMTSRLMWSCDNNV